MSQTEPKTCLDCCNFVGYCKVASHPRVEAYCRDATNFVDADMSHCPGFVEDL